jgi:hypothetical protein
MKQQLEKVSKFTKDGRLKTAFNATFDSLSPFDRDGVLKTKFKTTIDDVSRVDRMTGLPKGA